MNEKIEEILELPVAIRIGIFAGTLALVLLGYFFLFYRDMGAKLQETRQAVEKLDDEIRQKTAIVAKLPEFEKEVERLDIELNKALRELPDKKEIDQLLARISDKAKDSGLDIRLFQPQNEQLRDFYAEVPVQIEVMGSFHQVATFFDEVARLERIVNVDEFSIIEPKVKDEDVTVKTSAIATSFRFLSEGERPQEDGKKRQRRRAGR
ncbi:MAG TPA: type 4a pilus biogenesis protein PilO [Oligoflexia bacterium]|nr:type 4a pilus biogenesis protein PilO [Oligoflexia bacterium]